MMLQEKTIQEKVNNFLDLKNKLENLFPNLSEYEIEKIIEKIYCTNLIIEKEEADLWIDEIKKNSETTVEEINLNESEKWNVDNNGNITHDTGKFFKIIALRTKNSKSREVGEKGWDQPIIAEVSKDGGILGLLRAYIQGLPHYLVEAKFEPGNYGFIQLSPTLQATFSNIEKAHGGRTPNYYEFFEDFQSNKENYLFNQWLNEDGGRLNQKRNRGLVKNINYDEVGELKENFIWLSFNQVDQYIKEGKLVNPHLARLIYLV